MVFLGTCIIYGPQRLQSPEFALTLSCIGNNKRARYEHGLAGPAGASWVDRGSGTGVWASAGQCDKGRSVV